MNQERIRLKKPCPFCGGKIELKRWGLYYEPEKFQFACECKKCYLHSEIADTAKKAVENFEQENFSELQKGLTRNIKDIEVDSDSVDSLVAAILKNATAGFKDKCKIYYSADPKSEDYQEHKKSFEVAEKDYRKTVDYWMSWTGGSDGIIEKLKKQIKEEVEDEQRRAKRPDRTI